jgi:hypothetical protein
LAVIHFIRQASDMAVVFSRLLPVVTSAYALQAGKQCATHMPIEISQTCPACALYFVPKANEKYYDLAGALGFVSTTFISLYYPALRAKFWDKIPGAALPRLDSFAPRQLLATAALSMWTIRLGSFLVTVSRDLEVTQLGYMQYHFSTYDDREH